MVKLRSEAIVERLEAMGMKHRTVRFQTEGDYLPLDVDWNNKDVVHRNSVHRRIEDVAFVMEHDLQASLSYQKVLGIRLPLVLVHYDTSVHHQTHVLTLFAWTMVTEHEFAEVAANRTRATTSYTVAARPVWMAFWPLIRVLLRNNYRTLMSEDVPMRERRGQLRRWGLRFQGDGPGARDLRETISVNADNVLAPVDGAPHPTFDPVPLKDIDAGWTYVGRSDHLGLKLTRQGSKLLAYARMCPHEGADLDPVPVTDRCQVCPWHGRRLPPLAVVDLESPAPVHAGVHRLAIEDGCVVITVAAVAARGA